MPDGCKQTSQRAARKLSFFSELKRRNVIRVGDGVFGKALQFALLGEYESALESLETGLAAGDPYAASMSYMKVYALLRDNPRFQAMLRKMNLLP